MGEVPSGLRNAQQIYSWFVKEFNLPQQEQEL
jgi:hypothetical protein